MNGKITIGLDCSTRSTGYGVFQNDKLIDYGIIKSEELDWRNRLLIQSKVLGELFDKYNPEEVFVEDVPLNPRGGIKTAVMLGAVQGMVYGLGASRKIEMKFVLPSVWRSPLGLFDGTKEGKKREVLKQKSVEKANELFGLELVYKSPSSKQNCDDISDAILLCYSQIKQRCFGKSIDK